MTFINLAYSVNIN